MSRSILSTSPWFLFVAFVIGITVADVAARIVADSLDWNRDYGPYPNLRFALMSLVWWSYPYLVGRSLSQRSGSPSAHRRILLIVALAILINASSVYYIETFGLLWPVVLFTALSNTFFLGFVFAFPARELKSIELERKARFPELFADLIQFMIWPISVWWLQERLRAGVMSHEKSIP